MSERVAVLGASNKPDRYAYKAVKLLLEHGHEVIPIHPIIDAIDDLQVVASLSDVPKPIDTLTLYVNPKVSAEMTDDILALAPKRVIFNPGTESAELEAKLSESGIRTQEACTLVLLHTAQY